MVTGGLGPVLLSKHAVCDDGRCCEKDECINKLHYEQLCTHCNVQDVTREEQVRRMCRPVPVKVQVYWC